MSSKDRVDTADGKDSPEEIWIKDELRQEVKQALSKLSKKDEEIIVLRYYLDKSYAEMSEITGRPENTVASLLNRAKKKLLKVLNEGEKL